MKEYEKAILKHNYQEQPVYIYRLYPGPGDGEITGILVDDQKRLFRASIWGANNTSLTIQDWI